MYKDDLNAKNARLPDAQVPPQPATLNPQPSTLNPQPSTLNPLCQESWAARRAGVLLSGA
jgi:hypothetical protein